MTTIIRLLLLAAIAAIVPMRLANAQSVGKGLVINGIYIGSAAPANGVSNDEFIELYNPQQTTQYLDGCMIVRFGASGGKLSANALQGVVEAWKFPGRPGGRTLAVPSGTFVVIAGSARTYSGGLDLSGAQFETVVSGASRDQDNSSSINLHKVSVTGSQSDLALSATMDAVVLTNGADSVTSDGINLAGVLDGVNYNVAWTAGNLPASIDAGYTGGPNLKYGLALERNTKGKTTLNSSVDFGLQYPTPGSEHGSTPPPPPPSVVKVTDLMPFDIGRYVDYNEYVTDSLGTPQLSTRAHSSNTVFAKGLSYAGSNGVALIRDTASGGPLAGGSTADFHYVATAAGDIQVFADTTFFQQSLPPGFGAGLTAPNKFVDYLKMSQGANKSYPITTLNANLTYSGLPITITIVPTGSYLGVARISVPEGQVDSAYKFAITFDITAAATIFGQPTPIGHTTVLQQLWLERGVGIIKSNTPTVNFAVGLLGNNTVIPIPGNERDMTAHGIRSLSGVPVIPSLRSAPAVQFYPDPAPDAITVKFPKPARLVTLYGITGRMVRSYDIAGESPEALLAVNDLANGMYQARVQFADGTETVMKIAVRH